jgi:hypothetical protein
MGRVWLAGLCVVAGVGVLAGVGWALLAAAAVVYLTPVPPRVRQLATSARDRATVAAGKAWRWLSTGRHQVAMGITPVALVLVPFGTSLVFGLGWALIVLGGLAAGVGLLLGWDPRPGTTP